MQNHLNLQNKTNSYVRFMKKIIINLKKTNTNLLEVWFLISKQYVEANKLRHFI